MSFFTKLPDYQPGDLMTREAVAPLFDDLKRAGWAVPDRDKIVEQIPASGEMFVQKLGTRKGKKFMRSIAKYPLSFDRVDRLSHMPMSELNVQALVDGPDGWKMLQYMTETVWGRNLGKQLSNGPGGANFNAPTGRIYTAEALLDRLQQSYDAQQLRQAKAASKMQ